jgi:hypothetical protein
MNLDIFFITALVAILVHTGALFYWGGAVKQMLRDHERRLGKLEYREAVDRRQT